MFGNTRPHTARTYAGQTSCWRVVTVE